MTSNLRSRFDRELVHRFGIVAVLLLISVALAATTDSFATASNLTNVARQVSSTASSRSA